MHRMILSKRHLYIKVIMMSIVFSVTHGIMCKWSNEDCSANDQCCSKRCITKHEGTDPRCASSPMHYPCFFDYQCDDDLACGEFYNCCSPFWGVCSIQDECCDVTHVCREEDGFIYKRCLPPSAANKLAVDCLMLSIITYFYIRWAIFRP